MINYQLFPHSRGIDGKLQGVIDVFKTVDAKKSSAHLVSNDMLALVRPGLEDLGFIVEKGKKKKDLISVPVLFGENGVVEKSFWVDALHVDDKIVIEVESGRAVSNYQFLKDLFEACMMPEIEHLVIAVLNEYVTGSGDKTTKSRDYQTVKAFLEPLYASNRLHLPLKSILVIGY